MRRLLIPSLLAALALCASGCPANPGPGGGGQLQNLPPGPVEADFTLVSEAHDVASYGGASIWGTGLHSASGVELTPPGEEPAPIADPYIDPTSGALEVVFDTGVDASDCLAAAQRAEISGTELVITGTGTSQIFAPPANASGRTCGGNMPMTPHWVVDIQVLTTCTADAEPTPNFSAHFAAVTSAVAPSPCSSSDATCVPSGSIVGTAATTSDSDGTSQSYGPFNTTLTFPAGTCASIAEQANTDGRGLTVTGVGTVDTLAVDPACISAPDGTLSCGQGGINTFIDATVIATCVEDPPGSTN